MFVLDAVLRAIEGALAALPPERGGALLGPRGRPLVTRFESDPESSGSAVSWRPSRALDARVKALEREEELELKGLVHSHPPGQDRPSAKDAAEVGEGLRRNGHLGCLPRANRDGGPGRPARAARGGAPVGQDLLLRGRARRRRRAGGVAPSSRGRSSRCCATIEATAAALGGGARGGRSSRGSARCRFRRAGSSCRAAASCSCSRPRDTPRSPRSRSSRPPAASPGSCSSPGRSTRRRQGGSRARCGAPSRRRAPRRGRRPSARGSSRAPPGSSATPSRRGPCSSRGAGRSARTSPSSSSGAAWARSRWWTPSRSRRRTSRGRRTRRRTSGARRWRPSRGGSCDPSRRCGSSGTRAPLDALEPEALDAAVRGADLVVAATDDPAAQRVLNRFAHGRGRPALFPGLYAGARGGEV